MDTFFVNKNIISQIYLCGEVYFLIINMLKKLSFNKRLQRTNEIMYT